MNRRRLRTAWGETDEWQKDSGRLRKKKPTFEGFREPKPARLLRVFIHKTARGNIPDPNVHPAGLPVMFPLQHEITCHKQAEKSEGGEEDKCSRGKRGGQAWCDKQADWHQPLTGMLSAAADWGASRALFVFCRRKIQSTIREPVTSCLDVL